MSQMADTLAADFRTWFRAASGLSEEAVIYANGGGPRPTERPYATILITNAGERVGVTDVVQLTDVLVGGEYVQHVTGERRATASVQVFGDGCEAILRRASAALALPDEDLALQVVSAGAVSPVPRLLDTNWEPRATCTYGLSFFDEFTTTPATAPGHIESITAAFDIEPGPDTEASAHE